MKEEKEKIKELEDKLKEKDMRLHNLTVLYDGLLKKIEQKDKEYWNW